MIRRFLFSIVSLVCTASLLAGGIFTVHIAKEKNKQVLEGVIISEDLELLRKECNVYETNPNFGTACERLRTEFATNEESILYSLSIQGRPLDSDGFFMDDPNYIPFQYPENVVFEVNGKLINGWGEVIGDSNTDYTQELYDPMFPEVKPEDVTTIEVPIIEDIEEEPIEEEPIEEEDEDKEEEEPDETPNEEMPEETPEDETEDGENLPEDENTPSEEVSDEETPEVTEEDEPEVPEEVTPDEECTCADCEEDCTDTCTCDDEANNDIKREAEEYVNYLNETEGINTSSLEDATEHISPDVKDEVPVREDSNEEGEEEPFTKEVQALPESSVIKED